MSQKVENVYNLVNTCSSKPISYCCFGMWLFFIFCAAFLFVFVFCAAFLVSVLLFLVSVLLWMTKLVCWLLYLHSSYLRFQPVLELFFAVFLWIFLVFPSNFVLFYALYSIHVLITGCTKTICCKTFFIFTHDLLQQVQTSSEIEKRGDDVEVYL